MENIILSNKNQVPALGFGTYMLNGKDCTNAVIEAITLGYRHIDTAVAYKNEEFVGDAIEYCIKNNIVKREELFINTKLCHHEPIGYQNAMKSFHESLKRLRVDYLDSYLIHWPNVTKDGSWKQLNKETWKAMEELYEQGLVKNIGVSNFEIHHLEELLKTAKIRPAVNQLNLSPVWQQKQLVDFCWKQGIQPMAWQTIVTDEWAKRVLLPIACKHNRSIPQICLRYGLQKGWGVLAKTDVKEYMLENMAVFDFKLDDDDLAKMDTLNSYPANHVCQPDALYGILEYIEKTTEKTLIEEIKFKLFNALPFLKVKYIYKDINLYQIKYYLFNFLLIWRNKFKSRENSMIYLLGFIPLFKIKRKIESSRQTLIPAYNIEELCRM